MLTPAQVPIDLREPAPYPQLTYEQHDNLGGWRKLGAVLLLSLLAVLALNALAFAALEDSAVNIGTAIVRAKWRLLESLSTPVDWLILGDSSGNQGFDPSLLEAEYGLSSINVATIADWGLVDDAWMLEGYIERFGAPRAAVLIHVYDAYQRHLEGTVLGQSSFGLGFWDQHNFKIALPLTEQVNFATTRYFPLYAQNLSIARISGNFLAGQAEQPLELVQGFMLRTTPDPERVFSDTGKHLTTLKEQVFQPSQTNQAALEYMIGLAESQGFPLYLKDSPIFAGLYEAEVFQAYYSSLQAWLYDLDAQSTAFIYLDEPSLFQPNMLQNADHVTVEGATIFTRQVAELILAQEAAP